MSEKEVLLRHLDREKRARKEAEKIGEEKLAELYKANCRLEGLLAKQKKININLKKRTQDLEMQTGKTNEEKTAKIMLENILESSTEYSIIGTNSEGIVLVWNQGAMNNYGFHADEMVNKQNISVLYTPEDITSGRVQRFLDKAYQYGKVEGTFEGVRKNKSRFTALINLGLRRDENGVPVGYILISKDITSARLMEEQLIRSNQELEKFAYIASHDLKAPLRAIERLSGWIVEDCEEKLDGQSKENLVLLKRRANRMTNLIDGILQYSRAGRVDLNVSVVETKMLIQEIIDSLNPGKQFTIHYSDTLPKFRTAKIPLNQVFSNLINNSIKHHHRKTGTIEIGVRDLGDFYEFFVADDGPGIAPEYFEKIFQVFQTLKSKDEVESTGIGLSIVKKIVEYHGGEIRVESEIGKGAVFRFTWPKFPRNKKNKSSKS